MPVNEKISREMTVQTEDFEFHGEFDISPEVDNPELLADELEDCLSDALVEFVVEQSD